MRTPIIFAEREAFGLALEERLPQGREEDRKLPIASVGSEREERAHPRKALGRARVEHGYLCYMRNRIYPPIR